jgi:hypothetical protein
MAHKYASPADKLARQILKAVTKGFVGQPLTLSLVSASFVDETPDAIRAAIAHGFRKGWLAVGTNGWSVTPAGEKIGRHSRAGVMNKVRRL